MWTLSATGLMAEIPMSQSATIYVVMVSLKKLIGERHGLQGVRMCLTPIWKY